MVKLTVIIPSEDSRQTAGVRIRYNRLIPELAASGHVLELQPIDSFRADTQFDSDAYLFSKTYDVSAEVLARIIRAAGRRVGVDVFDDYFSQSEDSRLVHMRRWFRSMRAHLDFALCATPAMADRLMDLTPGLPVHVVNDPAGHFDREVAGQNVARNLARARKTRVLDIGWFGIGDNPYYSVGLEDLHAFSEGFAICRRLGCDVRLRVLTNQRALTLERLEMLARVPVKLSLKDWSEEAERTLIAESVACFLPVNGQAFSTAKSLNRALSVLTGGAQVLSAGYPLYDRLTPFIYRNFADLINDIDRRDMKFSGPSIGAFSDLLSDLGDAHTEAARLIRFLQGVVEPIAKTWPRKGHQVAVVHGMGSTGEAHNAALRLECLSVAAPQSTMKVNYDVICKPRRDADGLDITLSKRAFSKLIDDHARRAKSVGKMDDKPVYRLHLKATTFLDAHWLERPARPPEQFVELERYGRNVGLIRRLLDVLFGPTEVLLSERVSPYSEPASDAPLPSSQMRFAAAKV